MLMYVFSATHTPSIIFEVTLVFVSWQLAYRNNGIRVSKCVLMCDLMCGCSCAVHKVKPRYKEPYYNEFIYITKFFNSLLQL